ncbi:MAG: HypC/HybG/HupF family hydrogenase formation chaperone [Planctomycetota bacterium]|nr:HypC/HybG/HupF family hydrogenase formation chaperone [Planctomycetota bacterium]
MCLSIPAKLLEIEGLRARADVGGNVVRVDLSLLPDAKPGEYVLVHAGFALDRYQPGEAERILGYFQEMGMIPADAGDEAGTGIGTDREAGARPG